MPDGFSGRAQKLRETLRAMAVGDSFLYDADTVTHVYNEAKRLGMKIQSRKQIKGGWRVWRKA